MHPGMSVRFQLKRSRCLMFFTLALHAAAWSVLALTMLSWSELLLVSLMICISLVYTLFRFVRPRIDEVAYAQALYSCYAGTQLVCSGAALAGTVVTPLFILLRLNSPGIFRMHTVLICRDALAPDEYRQLAVILRLA